MKTMTMLAALLALAGAAAGCGGSSEMSRGDVETTVTEGIQKQIQQRGWTLSVQQPPTALCVHEDGHRWSCVVKGWARPPYDDLAPYQESQNLTVSVDATCDDRACVWGSDL